MNDSILFYALPLLFALSFSSAHSEPLPPNESSILVTASRIPTAPEKSALSATVIEIEESQSQSIAQILQNVSGLEIRNQGGFGKSSSLFVRGANSEHVLVLIDGVEVNDPSSPNRAFDFARLSSQDVERVEILKGPQSVLYGSEALGGVINLITRKGQEGRPSISFEGGSFGYRKAGISLQDENRYFRYRASFSRFSLDGFSAANQEDGNSEADGHRQTDASLSVISELGNVSRLQFNASFLDSSSDIDSGGGPQGDDPNFVEDAKQLSSGLQLSSFLLAKNLETLVSLGYSRTDRQNINNPDVDNPSSTNSTFKGRTFKASLQEVYSLNKNNTFAVGYEFEEEVGESSFLAKSRANTKSIFLQSQNRWENWFGDLGLRFDKHSIGAVEATTFRISQGYEISQTGTTLKATVGSGFKTPSLFQILDPTFGNTDLEPERVLSFEVGIRQRTPSLRHSLNLTYFRNAFENLISFDPVTFQSININKAKTDGLEFDWRSKITSKLNLNANYTYLFNFKNETTGQDLLRRSQNSWQVGFDYRPLPQLRLSTSFRRVGRRPDLDAGDFSRVQVDGYNLLNLSANYDWSQKSQIFLRFENLLDADYEEVDGFGTSPLAAYAGIHLTI